MKASDIIHSPPPLPQRLCRDFEAERYLKSPVVLKAFIDAGWIAPALSQHKLVLFDYQDLDRCVDRMKTEGLPQSSSISSSRGAK